MPQPTGKDDRVANISHTYHIYRGIAPSDNHVYISSSDPVSGGILCYEYDRDQQHLLQTPSSPKLVLKNGTPECSKAHGLAIMLSHQIAFTDVSARQVKILSLDVVDGNSTAVKLMSGSGLDRHTDGAKTSFSQLTLCCACGKLETECDWTQVYHVFYPP